MRTVLILMKREIIDHAAYFVCAAIASGILIALTAAIVLSHNEKGEPAVLLIGLVPMAIFVVVGLSALGVSQMLSDQTRRISAFLIALPVTRAQIFTARVLTGVLAILVLLIPLTVAGRILIDLRASELPRHPGLLADLFWGISLTCLACYAVGLYAGWGARSLAPRLAVLPIGVLIPFLIVTKGFGVELVALLLVLSIACLARAWCKFSNSAL
jgi:hypothetical protein